MVGELKALREAAQAVLTELDIIRDHRAKSGVGYLAVHIDTHNDLRAALASAQVEGPERVIGNCGCNCVCHADESLPEWPGSCAACCEPAMNCDCGRATAYLASPAEGLDVEQLARALVTATREQAGEPDGEGWPGYVYFGKPRDVAVVLHVTGLSEAIAAEYARLDRLHWH